MKKFLSLALALVMALSLVTISAGAKEFKDDSSITYDEAVAVISEIGVVDGYTDGNFNPQNVLTRGAAAKIICNLILGPTTASALPADTAPFKDVPANHEFAGYIAYCAQQGIINGYSDGSFRPAGTLDGYSFMKMLLGALGYDGSIEGFTGGNWSTNVAKLALGIGLDDGNDEFVGSKAVTREEACLYAFNALQADMVDYDSKTSVSVGGAEVVITGSKAEVQPQGVYKDTMDDEGLQFAEKYFDNLKKDDTSDDFGRPATTWKLKNEEIGTFANTGDLVATFTAKVTKAKVYSAVGKTVSDDLKDGAATLHFWMDGVGTTVAKADVVNYMDKSNTGRIGSTGASNNANGTLTEVYVDDDSNTTIVMINTYVFQATEDYSTSKEQVKIADIDNGSGIKLSTYTLDIDDSDDFDITGVKEDDYILVNVANGEPKIAVVAEQVTGSVDSYVVGDAATVDGTDYSYSATASADTKAEIKSVDSDVVLVLDAYGYVIAVDEATGTANYVFITAADTTSSLSSTVKANAYFMDGTSGEITLKKVAGSTKTSDLKAAEGWYTYSKDSADKYTLTSAATSKYAADYDLALTGSADLTTNGKTSLYKVGSTTVRANADTVFVVEDEDGDIDVYTGIKNVPDITMTATASDPAAMGYVYKKDTGYATYVFIGLDGTDSKVDDASSDDSYIFVIGFDKTLKDSEDTYYRYKAIVDGAETKILTDDDTYNDATLYGEIKTSASTGRITDMTEVVTGDPSDKCYVETLSGSVAYSAGVLSIGSKDYSVDSDTQIVLIIDYKYSTDANKETLQSVMSDEDADYEIDNCSASSLKSILAGYSVTGEFYAITDDDYTDSDTLDFLFVHVTGAVEL
ncbi:S-layer homology domain-containing protein [Dysosmobacter sp. HCP28S3_G4]|uniref:S-layer homology domain-containing protein n=1 Tax=Dysosmobacter sp. HCP28S3_G4 TaxID=3438938 RepID=UPI003F8B7A9E